MHGKHLTQEERRKRKREALTAVACLVVCLLLPCLLSGGALQ